MTTAQELSLVKKAKKGNKEALSELWSQITPKLYGYLLNVLKNKQLAEDILQNTWLKAIDKLDSFKPRGVRFSAWLFAIARNECRQHWRKTAQQVNINIDDLEIGETTSSREMENNLMIEAAFKSLNKKEQELLRLRYIAQLSFKDIAQVLEISVVAARVRTHRVLKKAQNNFID